MLRKVFVERDDRFFDSRHKSAGAGELVGQIRHISELKGSRSGSAINSRYIKVFAKT